MSTYSQHYHQFQEQPLFIDPHAFDYGHYDPRRSKTPTDSLINHTGRSPGALTTTPPLSRNPSQPPEPSRDQFPEQMLWDNGSASNSPSSVRTPDGESFEVEMLDSESMRNFYNQNGNTMSTQTTHNTIPAMDSTMFFTDQAMFSDQVLQAALNEPIVNHAQRYQQHFNAQPLQSRHMSTVPIHTPAFNHNYTAQPPRHDPWNGQGPSRSSVIPHSGHVMFDPATDPGIYTQFIDIDSWTNSSTDPQYLISPSEPTVSPHDEAFSMTVQPLAHRPHHHLSHPHVQTHNPVEMRVTNASPSPDQQNFVNYNASSPLFTEYHSSGNQYMPSSPVTSSVGHQPRSPYQPAMSPSAASPCSSDSMMSSYPSSDSGMMIDPFPTHQTNNLIPPHAPHMKLDLSPTRGAAEVTFNASPEPESSTAAAKALAKSGGRALGTHLEPQVAKAAHDMRKIVACWHCVLQRDKCGPGDTCGRCLKRSQRPNADCGLGCTRIKLVDLSEYFLPALVTQMHEDSNLTHFVSKYIHQWGNVELTVWMTCGQEGMPRLAVKVYEFAPRGDALLEQIQYNMDPITHKRVGVKKRSPALGMVHINHNEEKKYDNYITDIVDNHLDSFGELCWEEADNDFQQKLFKLMTRVNPKSDDEAKLLREVYRLIVVTYIMSHTLTIAEETKIATLSRMHSYRGHGDYVENYTSPRMTNRQLKYFFSRLQRSIQTTVLNKLQQIFKSSKGCDKWLAAFVAVLGMCMALEDEQMTIHLVMATKSSTEGIDYRDAQDRADIANREIDTKMHFIQQIFRWKYNRKCNPMRDSDKDWENEVGFGDASSVNFVRQVAQLVKDNSDFLQQRQQVSISPANQTKYTSRLVGQFLLSFWLPNA
ncbi:hypothetical protein BKA66DRAFT_413171 [Pyrenochaeta sp. MPI-SDFR-AT-0127]|nr:hypothetical protein BKA66DRAFT_413171 [Pyrenochaeta sp. MPI-SDFR-AT-0127]